MRGIVAIVICLLYFAGVLVGVPLAGQPFAPWFLAVWSAVFVACYLVVTRGNRIAAVSIVIVVTLVLPFAALVAIAWPIYHSWPAMVASFGGALQERGSFGIIELLAPLAVALLCLLLLKQFGPAIARG
jgi:hypothetical protein